MGDHADTINALTFSPNRNWLYAATGPTIKIWDLESKNMVEELRPEVPGTARADPPQFLSLAWSADGQTLFAGYSDNLIRVWQVSVSTQSTFFFFFFFLKNKFSLKILTYF